MWILSGIVLASLVGASGESGAVISEAGAGKTAQAAAIEEVQTPVEGSEVTVPSLHQVVTVTGEERDSRLVPDYREAPRPRKLVGIVSIGGSGRPGFDPVTRTYWWER